MISRWTVAAIIAFALVAALFVFPQFAAIFGGLSLIIVALIMLFAWPLTVVAVSLIFAKAIKGWRKDGQGKNL